MSVSTDKVKITMSLDSDLDQQLRILAAKQRRPFSDITGEALRYCLDNRTFLARLEEKYQKNKEPEY